MDILQSLQFFTILKDFIENLELLEKSIKDNDNKTCRNILAKSNEKNPITDMNYTALNRAAYHNNRVIFNLLMNKVTDKKSQKYLWIDPPS